MLFVAIQREIELTQRIPRITYASGFLRLSNQDAALRVRDGIAYVDKYSVAVLDWSQYPTVRMLGRIESNQGIAAIRYA